MLMLDVFMVCFDRFHFLNIAVTILTDVGLLFPCKNLFFHYHPATEKPFHKNILWFCEGITNIYTKAYYMIPVEVHSYVLLEAYRLPQMHKLLSNEELSYLYV